MSDTDLALKCMKIVSRNARHLGGTQAVGDMITDELQKYMDGKGDFERCSRLLSTWAKMRGEQVEWWEAMIATAEQADD